MPTTCWEVRPVFVAISLGLYPLSSSCLMPARISSGRHWRRAMFSAKLMMKASSSLATTTGDELQGEGDHRAARRYDNHVRDFIGEGRVEAAAIDAAWAVDDAVPSLTAADDTGKFSPTNGHF